jgi:hypothetical protein
VSFYGIHIQTTLTRSYQPIPSTAPVVPTRCVATMRFCFPGKPRAPECWTRILDPARTAWNVAKPLSALPRGKERLGFICMHDAEEVEVLVESKEWIWFPEERKCGPAS